MALSEAFTVLAVFEAVDKMSRVVEKMDAGLDKFSETTVKAAESASAAGVKIDESLLKTASGADAVELADARLSAAQDKLAASSAKQAEAEHALLDAQAQAAAAADGDVLATDRLVAASDELAAAQRRTSAAATEVTAAQDRQAATARATAAASTTAAGETDAAAAAQTRMSAASERSAAAAGIASKALKYGALGVAAIGYESVKAAGNFQSMTEHLVTDAGESQQNIGMIRSGMLALATTTGTTTEQMAQGMYHIESAGFHGKQALDVLKAAAEGAKVGGADLDVVGKTLTGTMNSYASSGYSATQMMNMLITAVGQGDMKMNDLASSLGNVAPAAAAAHIQISQVLGAIATMTAQNMSAAQATQDLNHTIMSLQNPTLVQIKEMQAMGLSSNDLSANLGKRGLSGTLDMLVTAIAAHTKGGMVFQSTLKSSEMAAANANIALKALPPSIQGVAKGLLNGTVTTTQYGKALKDLPLSQKALAQQFEGLVKKTSSFNDLLKSGSPAAQTMNAALAKMTGGTTGLTTALMLTGGRAAAFADSAAKVDEVGKKTGTTVDNWGEIQKTFNQKMDVAKASVEAAGISIGTALLPAVSAIAGAIASVLGPMATFLAQHQKWVGLGLAVAGAILAVVAAIKAWEIVQTVMNVLTAIFAGEEAAILSPIELVVIAIAALVAGLVYAYFHFKVFRDVVNEVFTVVKTIVMTYISLIILEFKLLVAAAMLVWSGLQAAWSGIASAAQAVWSFLVGAWNAVYDTTMTVWNAITGFFKKWWPLLLVIFLPMVALVLAIWNHFHTEIIGTAKTVWNAVKSFLSSTWGVIVSLATGAWKLFQTVIIKPIQAVWNFLQPTFRAIASFLAAVWRGIESVASAVWTGIKAAIINPITGAWHTVVSVVGSIASAISRGLQGAWDAVSNIGSKFLSIGSDIINGIIQGVENMGSALFGSVENIAKGALNAAKSFLGIGSPSKEFASQVGQWIPHGIAAGVDQYASVAHAAVGRLSSSLTAKAHTAITGSVSLSGAGAGAGLAYAGGGGGGGITINLSPDLRGAVISTPQAMKQLADQVGRSITQELARAGVHIRA